MRRKNIAAKTDPRQPVMVERPAALPILDNNIPEDLKVRPQWVGWQYEADARRQKWVKRPYTTEVPSSQPASRTLRRGVPIKKPSRRPLLRAGTASGSPSQRLTAWSVSTSTIAGTPRTASLPAGLVTIIERLASYTEIFCRVLVLRSS